MNIDLEGLIDCGALDLAEAFGKETEWDTLCTVLAFDSDEDPHRCRAEYIIQRAEEYGIKVWRWAITVDGKPNGDAGNPWLSEAEAREDAIAFAGQHENPHCSRCDQVLEEPHFTRPGAPRKPLWQAVYGAVVCLDCRSAAVEKPATSPRPITTNERTTTR